MKHLMYGALIQLADGEEYVSLKYHDKEMEVVGRKSAWVANVVETRLAEEIGEDDVTGIRYDAVRSFEAEQSRKNRKQKLKRASTVPNVKDREYDILPSALGNGFVPSTLTNMVLRPVT